jgi:hypothetical protein
LTWANARGELATVEREIRKLVQATKDGAALSIKHAAALSAPVADQVQQLQLEREVARASRIEAPQSRGSSSRRPCLRSRTRVMSECFRLVKFLPKGRVPGILPS